MADALRRPERAVAIQAGAAQQVGRADQKHHSQPDQTYPLYEQRWEFETLLDELKTHQRGSRVVLRSKLPEGVRQELYGYLCVHFAIRWLMHSVALGVDADPDRLSFIRTLRVARRTTASHPGFSPSES